MDGIQGMEGIYIENLKIIYLHNNEGINYYIPR